MVIGEFSDSYPPLMDGVGGVIKNYTQALRSLGHEAYVLTGGYFNAQEYDKENDCQDYVFRMPAKPNKLVYPYGTLKCPKALFERLMDIPFDLIHIHSPFYAGKVGIKIAKAKNIPLVGTFHTLIGDDINNIVHCKGLSNLAVKFIMGNYQGCKELWVPSQATLRVLSQSPYNYKKPITCMENGCDMIRPEQQELDRMKEGAYNFSKTDSEVPIVMFVGQHKDAKNIPLVLESLDILNKQNFNFQMLFVGVGPQADAYRAFVKNHGLDKKVSFLGKISDRRMMAGLFAISSLFLFPSLYDTSCLVMREAACFDLPVAFIKGACTSEGIEDGVNGYLSENTPQSFSGTIRRALENPERNLKVGQKAREDLYRSWDAIIKDDVLPRYENLVGHKS